MKPVYTSVLVEKYNKDNALARKTIEKHGLTNTTKTLAKVILYLLLFSLLSFAAGLKISTEPCYQKADTFHTGEVRSDNLKQSSLTSLGPLLKAASLIVLTGLGIFGFLYYLNQKLLAPLNRIAGSLEEILNGNLRGTISVKGIDEVCRVSSLVNDVSANFQETLLLTASLNNSSLKSLEKLDTLVNCLSPCDQTVVQEELEALRNNMEELNEVIHYFEFYHVKVNDGHILNKV